jgi:hypothetical protein
MVVHLDGVISTETTYALERHILSLTGIDADKMIEASFAAGVDKDEEVTAVQFAQLLIAWRFLELINCKLGKIQ